MSDVEERSAATDVCVAVIVSSSVILKEWIAHEMTTDCSVFHYGFQWKSHPRDIIPILQYKKSLLDSCSLLSSCGNSTWNSVSVIPIHRSKVAENALIRVQNHDQSACVAISSAVKFKNTETIRTVPLQKRKLFYRELSGEI
jgi:hypothetical protein